jgi:uncharacterized membrane protein
MRTHWRKIAYAAFWVLLLAIALESFAHPEADEKTRAVMLGIVMLFAVPISFIPMFLVYAINWLPSDTATTIEAVLFGDSIVHLLLWWLVMFAISYWQWFHLFPKLMSRFPGRRDA